MMSLEYLKEEIGMEGKSVEAKTKRKLKLKVEGRKEAKEGRKEAKLRRKLKLKVEGRREAKTKGGS